MGPSYVPQTHIAIIMGPSYVPQTHMAIWVYLNYVPQTHKAICVHLMYSPQIIVQRLGERTQTTPMYIRQTHIRAILYHGPILC